MTKRLFLFASYDKNNVVDDMVIHYIKHLSTLGDVIFVMDNDVPQSELKKIKNIDNVLYANASKHNEYDFGSYKRGYIWAKDNKILQKYDWIYLVNDSVYGPLNPLNNILSDLESRGADEIGMVENAEEFHPVHIQSWFLGVSKNIFSKKFFDDFMLNIKHEDCKWDIITKYEVRLSRLILRQGFNFSAFIKNSVKGKKNIIYAHPISALINGVPFIKKAALGFVPSQALLNAHTDFPDIIDKIFCNIKKDDISMTGDMGNKYIKKFRLSFIAVPVFSVRKKIAYKEYKVYLFDKIPILKISK